MSFSIVLQQKRHLDCEFLFVHLIHWCRFDPAAFFLCLCLGSDHFFGFFFLDRLCFPNFLLPITFPFSLFSLLVPSCFIYIEIKLHLPRTFFLFCLLPLYSSVFSADKPSKPLSCCFCSQHFSSHKLLFNNSDVFDSQLSFKISEHGCFQPSFELSSIKFPLCV